MVPSATASRTVGATVLPSPTWRSAGKSVSRASATAANLACCLASGLTKNSISAMVNSRTRSKPPRGAISLRYAVPICATPMGMRPLL